MTAAVREPVQEMSSCLDSLRATLCGLDDKGIAQMLREIEVVSRKTQSVLLDAVTEADARGIAAREGFGTTQRLLAAMLRLSAAEARTRVEHAAAVGTRHTITGETLAPRLPATAAALAAGEIGAGQLRVITETMGATPASVPEPVRERVEADLAGYARDFDPRRLRTIAHRVLAHLDPDGSKPADDPAPATRTRDADPRRAVAARPPRRTPGPGGLAGPCARHPGALADRAARRARPRHRRRARHPHRAAAPGRCAHRAV